jgi:hypothetical protein
VSLHASRVDELLVAILTSERLMEVIAEGFSAELLATNSADEVLRMTFEVLAVVSDLFVSGLED